jgi:CHAT domain-containing protein
MSRYPVLHFATHGVFDDQNPMYSYTVLSQDDGGDEDGLLEAREIINLELKASIAILSACETARGQVKIGEGMLGLRWALFVAGCWQSGQAGFVHPKGPLSAFCF